MASLALRYRPRVFGDVVGQDRVTAVLRAMVVKDELPSAMIFGGVRGTGKTTLARILPAALNCPDRLPNGDPCGVCHSCQDVWHTSSLSVLEIDAASNSGKDDANRLRNLSMFAHEGAWRVIVLDEAHMLSNEASNALLKTLEEPPSKTVFLLLTTETHNIIETIRSRAMHFEFHRISPEVILQRLHVVAAAEGITCDEAVFQNIARTARGGMRDALMRLDQAQLVGVQTLADYEQMFGLKELAPDMLHACLDRDFARIAAVAVESVSCAGDASTLIREMTELVRDLLVLQSGGMPVCSMQQIPDRQQILSRINPMRLPAALRVLWRAADRARQEDDQIIAAQICAVSLSEVLSADEAPIVQVREEAALSADEMADMIKAASLG